MSVVQVQRAVAGLGQRAIAIEPIAIEQALPSDVITAHVEGRRGRRRQRSIEGGRPIAARNLQRAAAEIQGVTTGADRDTRRCIDNQRAAGEGERTVARTLVTQRDALRNGESRAIGNGERALARVTDNHRTANIQGGVRVRNQHRAVAPAV